MCNYLPPLQLEWLSRKGIPDLLEDIPAVLTDGGDIAPRICAKYYAPV
jgi:hypothetical protein